MDKTSPTLIYVKWKYKKDILWRASPDIINGEERTSYKFLLCLMNLSSLFWLPFSIYLEYFSKLGVYLFRHVLENLSPPFQFPLIPTHLVSWGKHPLFLHPYYSSNTCKKSNSYLCNYRNCRESFMWNFEKIKKKKIEMPERGFSLKIILRKSPIFLHSLAKISFPFQRIFPI